MLQSFSRYAGVVQTVIGLLSTVLPQFGSALGAGSGGGIFNIISGAVLSYLGFKGTEANQRTGAQTVGGLNTLVGLLGILGVNQIAGVPLNEGAIANIINLAIGVWGLIAGFVKKPAQ